MALSKESYRTYSTILPPYTYEFKKKVKKYHWTQLCYISNTLCGGTSHVWYLNVWVKLQCYDPNTNGKGQDREFTVQ